VNALVAVTLSMISDWPTKLYNVVVLDPPWTYRVAHHTNKATNHYVTMPNCAIEALPVRDIMARESVALVWATCPCLHHAIYAIDCWGLHFRGVPFVWAKTRKDGRLMGAKGVSPNTVKPTTELVLAATIKRTGRGLPIMTQKLRQVVLAPCGKHSVKPQAVYDAIDELFGDEVSKIDMFARKLRPGWDVWGDEI